MLNYKGYRRQRGFGPAGFFRSAYDWISPRLRSAAKSLEPYARKFALNSATDLLEGERGFKNVLKRRALESGRNIQKDLLRNLRRNLQDQQQGKGLITASAIEDSHTMALPFGKARRKKRRAASNALRKIRLKTVRRIKKKKQSGGGRRKKKTVRRKNPRRSTNTRRRRRRGTRKLKASNHLFE